MVENSIGSDTNRDSAELKILKAAKSIFLEKGLDGARMQEIANEAGINKALLHYYFRSKENLYKNVLKSTMDEFFPNIFQIFLKKSSFRDKIYQFFDLYVGFLQENPQMPKFIVAEIVRKPEFLMDMFSTPKEFGFLEKLEVMIQESVSAGDIREISPQNFIVNLISLCVFPIITRPVWINIFDINDKQFDEFINERKTLTADFFIRAIE